MHSVTIPYLETHLPEQVRLVTEIIPIMSRIPAVSTEMTWPPEEALLLAWVNFAGEWSGSMVLSCTLPLAFQFTSRLMSVPLPASVDDDVRDSIAELANTIAGNFKALLPSGCSMSVPTVALHPAGASVPPLTGRLCECHFTTEPGACSVMLKAGQTKLT